MPLEHLQVVNLGTLVSVKPLTKFAKDWLQENLDPDVMMMGPAYMIEHRYWPDIRDGFNEDAYYEGKV